MKKKIEPHKEEYRALFFLYNKNVGPYEEEYRALFFFYTKNKAPCSSFTLRI